MAAKSPGNAAGPKAPIFAIGDVHGCVVELRALLKKLPITPACTVVFLGDYIDRGPDSRAVVDEVIALQNRCNVIALRGNHEDMLLQFLDRPESIGAVLFILNGGAATLAGYGDGEGGFSIPDAHLQFFKNLKLCWQTDDYFFVHAGVPDEPLATLDLAVNEDLMLWIRSPFLRSEYRWEKLIVHGHSPSAAPENLPNRINVDTGCVYNGELTAIELPARRFHSVPQGEHTRPLQLNTRGDGRAAVRFMGTAPVFIERGRGQEPLEFETLNYNMFGLLMQEKEGRAESLAVGDGVRGHIGPKTEKGVQIEGDIVRIERKAGLVLYGVKLVRIDSGG